MIEGLQAKNVELESALADIREAYAGSEGIPVAETCAEAYVIRLIEQMYSIAVEALNPTSAGGEWLDNLTAQAQEDGDYD